MPENYGDADYKFPLSDELWKKAKKELNEDDSTRLLEVKNLRKRIEKLPGLQANLKFTFLLPFLRARKFDQERTFQLVKNHYEVKRDNPDIFDDLKPSRVRNILSDGVVEILDQRSKEGCKIVVIRPGRRDADATSVSQIPKLMFMVFSKLVEDEETQINGVHLIMNMEGSTLKHATQITPSISKQMFSIVQDCVPLRLKKIDFVNEPTFFDILYALMKQFMKKKLFQRLTLHGPKVEKIHSSVDPEILPTDLGGKQPVLKDTSFMDNLLTLDAEFEQMGKFGFSNTAVGSEDSTSGSVAAQGLGGTFKKLEI